MSSNSGEGRFNQNGHKPQEPGGRRYNPRGGRPGLDVNLKAVCDAVQGARNGSGETITEVAARFGVSRGWIYKWVYPALDDRKDERYRTGSEQIDVQRPTH